jgi:acyl-CoA synthetase (AMP-forming)/AMP-acid ligase II
LHIAGRLNDTIVSRGRNVFAEDVETTALKSSRSFGVSSCVAFSIEVQNREQLVIVGEVKKRDQESREGAGAVEAIMRGVAEGHGMRVDAIAFIEEGRIAKTSSGKVRRYAYKEMYVEGKIGVEWESSGESACMPH